MIFTSGYLYSYSSTNISSSCLQMSEGLLLCFVTELHFIYFFVRDVATVVLVLIVLGLFVAASVSLLVLVGNWLVIW